MKENIKKICPKTLKEFFLDILCHSYKVTKNITKMKKLKIIDPLIIKKNDKGIKTKELKILYKNSLFITHFQNFS